MVPRAARCAAEDVPTDRPRRDGEEIMILPSRRAILGGLASTTAPWIPLPAGAAEQFGMVQGYAPR